MSDDLVTWLREQITWSLEYGRKNAARRPINPMRSHEMRDLIAGCEAELAILDEHPEAAGDPGHCARCQNWVYAVPAPWPCTTIRCVASGYRHRPGYRAEWKP